MRKITKEEIIQLKNNESRKKFLEDYETWGVASHNDFTQETYYECELPNGIRIVACKERRLTDLRAKTSTPLNFVEVEYFYFKDRGPFLVYTFRTYRTAQGTIIDELRKLKSELVRE